MNVALAIQSLNREQMGVFLTHFEAEPAGDGVCEGDCIFQILPIRAALFDSPLAELLFRYHFRESGEHKVKLTRRGGACLYEVTPTCELPLRIELGASGKGQLSQQPDFSKAIAYVVATTKESNEYGV